MSTTSISKGLAGLSEVPAIRYVQNRSLAAGLQAARHTPVAAATGGGVALEKVFRAWLQAYQGQWARLAGVASRQEVRRLRELVRALEYRLECLEQGADPQQARGTVTE